MTKLLAGVPLDGEGDEADVNSKEIKDTIASITSRI